MSQSCMGPVKCKTKTYEKHFSILKEIKIKNKEKVQRWILTWRQVQTSEFANKHQKEKMLLHCFTI